MTIGRDVLTTPGPVRLDDDIVSRFAACCKALGLAVDDRRRPADLLAARTGFTALTRLAHVGCRPAGRDRQTHCRDQVVGHRPNSPLWAHKGELGSG